MVPYICIYTYNSVAVANFTRVTRVLFFRLFVPEDEETSLGFACVRFRFEMPK